MRDLLKHEAATMLVLLAPFAVLPFVWDAAPAQVPIHWNWRGEVDQYGSKTVGLLLLPGLNVGVYLLLLFFPKIDPKKRTAWDHKPLPAVRFFTVLALTVLHFVTLTVALRAGAPSETRFVPLIVTLLFLMMGNYLGAIPPNYFLGIRTPWTLEDPAVWRKTHRLAGRLWVVTSAILLMAWPLTAARYFEPVFTTCILAMALVPAAYSFYVWKEQQARSS